jgi:Mob1/phocein family
MGGGGGGGTQASMRHLTNIFRRVYRIFAHAWFQHRGVFWQVEGHEGLYVFFKTVCDVYQLIPEDNYTIPGEAEGGDGDALETPVDKKSPEMGRMSSLKETGENGQSHAEEIGEGDATTTVSVGATTRRHKHTPSTGSHVTTIAEGSEEEEPSHNESDTQTLLEKAEPPRGRPVPSGEDILTNGLGRLSLADLSATIKDGPAEQPTPQPQNLEKNPFEDVGKKEHPAGAAREHVGDAATDFEGEKKEDTKHAAQQTSEQVDLSEDSSIVQGSDAELTFLIEGKDKEQESDEEEEEEERGGGDDDETVGAVEAKAEKEIEGETETA